MWKERKTESSASHSHTEFYFRKNYENDSFLPRCVRSMRAKSPNHLLTITKEWKMTPNATITGDCPLARTVACRPASDEHAVRPRSACAFPIWVTLTVRRMLPYFWDTDIPHPRGTINVAVTAQPASGGSFLGLPQVAVLRKPIVASVDKWPIGFSGSCCAFLK